VKLPFITHFSDLSNIFMQFAYQKIPPLHRASYHFLREVYRKYQCGLLMFQKRTFDFKSLTHKD